MEPILKNKAWLKNGRVAFRTINVTAILYEDRIELLKKNGNLMSKILFSQIDWVDWVKIPTESYLRFHLTSDEYFSLDFQSFIHRMIVYNTGVLGVIFGSYIGQSRNITQTWLQTLVKNGVRTK